VSGKPLLPVEWQSFLLNKPVTAKIVAMEVHGGTKIATINKGSRDDFKVGMKLLGEGQEPSPWGKNGEVLSVEERTAKVQVDDLNIGDILSSKYISSNPLYR
jgi:cell shape-determining protein MreC